MTRIRSPRPHPLARRALAAVAGIALSAAALSAWSADPAAEPPARLERWRSYSGVTWDTGATPVAFRNSVNAPIAGIHVDAKDRAFVSTPRLISADSPATLSILDTSTDGGPARLSAFPSAAGNATGAAPALHLRNVLGFHIDRRNGWLWALDMGFVAGETEAPAGGQKIVVYALDTGRVVKRLALDGVADRRGSFLNDIAVDEHRRIAYLSDSGLRSAPRNQAAIIVAELDTGRARRVLDRHPSVMPEAGAKVVSHGEEVWPGNPLVLGINGIALSPDARTLYWTVTTGTQVFAIDTERLRDAKASPARVAAAVRLLGGVGGNTDGIVTDARGRLYITDVTRNGIVRHDPATGTMTLLAADADVFWPDTPTLAANGDLLFTASRLNGHFAHAVKAGSERYDLWRLRLGTAP